MNMKVVKGGNDGCNNSMIFLEVRFSICYAVMMPLNNTFVVIDLRFPKLRGHSN